MAIKNKLLNILERFLDLLPAKFIEIYGNLMERKVEILNLGNLLFTEKGIMYLMNSELMLSMSMLIAL